MKILLVEDEPDSLEFLTLLLQQQGYDVTPAPSGEVALERAQESCPDVVISDLLMPGMSGDELLKRMRGMEATCRVFFIMLTGYPSVTRVVGAVSHGADEVLLKPIEPSKLAAILQAASQRVKEA